MADQNHNRDRFRRSAFTLIEVLIVVTIMGIIAAIIMPQMMTSALDSRDAALSHNLKVLRTQIEFFKTQHNDNPPGFGSRSPEDHLFKYSNAAGDISDTPSLDYPLGPYFADRNLVNPFNKASHLKVCANAAGQSPSESLSDNGQIVGWFYDPATGQIAANAEGNAPDGTPRVQE